MYTEEVVWYKSLKSYENIMIFGAKQAAHNTYSYIKDAGAEIDCYVVSERRDNPISMDNKPVKVFSEISEKIKKNGLIVISQGYDMDESMREILC